MFKFFGAMELQEEQLGLLERSLAAAPAPVRLDLLPVLKEAVQNRRQLWDDGETLLGTEVRNYGGEKRLNMWACASRARTTNFFRLQKFLKKLADYYECDAVETMAYDPKVRRVIERMSDGIEFSHVVIRLKRATDAEGSS